VVANVWLMHARMMCIQGRIMVCRSAINGEERRWGGSTGPDGDCSVCIRFRVEGDRLGSNYFRQVSTIFWKKKEINLHGKCRVMVPRRGTATVRAMNMCT